MGISPDKLQRLRIQRGLTLTELARISGLSLSMVSMIENGHTGGSPVTARKLAAALSEVGEPVTIDDLWIYT